MTMRHILAASLIALCSTVSTVHAQTLKSQTYIEPAKSFLLGGGQPGAFSVQGKNAGSVPVTVFVERNGKRDSLQTLLPGASVDAEFPAGAMAVFRNDSDARTAHMSLRVRGKTDNLGMRYEPARRGAPPP